MNNRIFVTFAIVATLSAAAFFLYYAVQFGMAALTAIFGDPRQLIVAVAAAVIMGAVGFSLTMGRGTLAAAGQQEKIAVWAALLMSIVSAITTSSGLLLVLSPNPQTGAILMVVMALLLGVGIQLSMLMYALRIGDSIQRLSPIVAHEDLTDPDDDTGPRLNGQTIAIVVMLFAVGAALIYGETVVQFLTRLADSVVDLENFDPTDAGTPRVLGFFLLLIALFVAVQRGLLKRPGSVIGLVLAFVIYGALLTFSAGFGFVSYFIASQSEELQAIDRDAVIRNDTSELINKIENAVREDAQDFLQRARSGPEYEDLSGRIDQLSELFIENRARLDDQVEAYRIRREEIINARERAAEAVSEAESRLREAVVARGQAEIDLQRARTTRDQNKEILQQAVLDADKEAIDAAEGRDGTGIKICGPNCRAAQARAQERREQLSALDTDVQNAELALSQAESDISDLEQVVENVRNSSADGVNLQDPVPPVIVDRTSFILPRNEYNTNPSREGLIRIGQTCGTARDMLGSLGLSGTTLPNCDISQVEAHLIRYRDAQDAIVGMEGPCSRSEEEKRLEEAALLNRAAPDPNNIPPYLLARQNWLSRCLNAANTGSDRMVPLAREASRLESEFFTAGFDTRRALRSLSDGNRYSFFAMLMAIIVDTAILFAGFAANAYKARGLDHGRADLVRNALGIVNPSAPSQAAQQVQMLSMPRTHAEIKDSPFTHRLSIEDLPGKHAANVKLIMDAAGPEFARFVDVNKAKFWLLHRNFVSLVTEFATSDQTQAMRPIWADQDGDERYGAGLGVGGMSAGAPTVAPIFDRVQGAMPVIPAPGQPSVSDGGKGQGEGPSAGPAAPDQGSIVDPEGDQQASLGSAPTVETASDEKNAPEMPSPSAKEGGIRGGVTPKSDAGQGAKDEAPPSQQSVKRRIEPSPDEE